MKSFGRIATRLGTRNIEIHHDRLLPAAHYHSFNRLVGPSVDLLMRDVRRHVDEVAGAGLIDILQPLAPSESRASLHNVQHRLQLAMMMRARLHVRLYNHRSGPELVGAGG